MRYTAAMWAERYRYRGDITSKLTHLTREARVDGKDLAPVEVLIKILNDQCIKGSRRVDECSPDEGVWGMYRCEESPSSLGRTLPSASSTPHCLL